MFDATGKDIPLKDSLYINNTYNYLRTYIEERYSHHNKNLIIFLVCVF